jgi:hypothetical protein
MRRPHPRSPQPTAALYGALAALLALSAHSLDTHAAEPPELLRLQGETDYRAWMERYGWKNLRPLSDSTKRFRIGNGALRLSSRGDSFLIGSELKGILPVALDQYPYLRFVVRIDQVPVSDDRSKEHLNDSAFRLYLATRASPPQSIAYAWTWDHPIGHWSSQGLTGLGSFSKVRHKSIGQGRPPAGRWITVEANLREDVRSQFPELAAPQLVGISLKADSNDSEGGSSLAWVREVSLHRASLRAEGFREGDTLAHTELWYR